MAGFRLYKDDRQRLTFLLQIFSRCCYQVFIVNSVRVANIESDQDKP